MRSVACTKSTVSTENKCAKVNLSTNRKVAQLMLFLTVFKYRLKLVGPLWAFPWLSITAFRVRRHLRGTRLSLHTCPFYVLLKVMLYMLANPRNYDSLLS